MTFSDDLNRFTVKVDVKTKEVFVGIVDEAHQSIQTGSPLTGAPGQPVDTGALRASWQKYFISPTEAEISTNLAYARPIEDGVGKYGSLILRSAVGGFHSVKLTLAGFQRIVDHVVQKVAK